MKVNAGQHSNPYALQSRRPAPDQASSCTAPASVVPDEYTPTPGRIAARVVSATALGLATSSLGLVAAGPAAAFLGAVAGAVVTPTLMLFNGARFDGELAGGGLMGVALGAVSGLLGTLGPAGVVAATGLLVAGHLRLGRGVDLLNLEHAKFWDSQAAKATTPSERQRCEASRDVSLEYLDLK